MHERMAHFMQRTILYSIVHILKAEIATGLKPGVNILQSLHYTRCKFPTRPFAVLAWQSQVPHMVENWLFYVSLWSSTISGKK